MCRKESDTFDFFGEVFEDSESEGNSVVGGGASAKFVDYDERAISSFFDDI